MFIETDKLCYGKLHFEELAGKARWRARTDNHDALDIAILWADDQIRALRDQVSALQTEPLPDPPKE